MKSENGSRHVANMYRGRIIKIGVLVAVSLMMMATYVAFFQHPPADELLSNNRHSMSGYGTRDFGASMFGDSQTGDDEADEEEKERVEKDDEDEEEEEAEEDEDFFNDATEGNGNGNNKNHKLSNKFSKENIKSKKDVGLKKEGEDDIVVHKKREFGHDSEIEDADYWAKYAKERNLVIIGAVYDKCEGRRKQLGAVAMMKDEKNGGIMMRTYVNVTLERTLDGGQLNIESHYNGRAMYDNYWELCEAEDDLPEEERTFTCPLKAGHYSKVKDKAIPSYIPKGRYQSKIWATDEEKTVIGCGFSDFTI